MLKAKLSIGGLWMGKEYSKALNVGDAGNIMDKTISDLTSAPPNIPS